MVTSEKITNTFIDKLQNKANQEGLICVGLDSDWSKLLTHITVWVKTPAAITQIKQLLKK